MRKDYGHDPRPAFDQAWRDEVNLDDVHATEALAEMLLEMLALIHHRTYLRAIDHRFVET